jgi:hypothetical protein
MSGELNSKLNDLAAKTRYISMKLDQGVQGDQKSKRVKDLLLRMGALQESSCPANFFPCGDVANTCVSKFLVCDQKQDCSNGRDEDAESTCRFPAFAGSHFEGRTIFDRCTKRRPQKVGLFISETERDHTFPSVAKITAQFTAMSQNSEYSFKGGLILHGNYFYAGHKIIFDAPESDGLGVEVQFLPGDEDLLSFSVIRESSGEVCAKADLHRV